MSSFLENPAADTEFRESPANNSMHDHGAGGGAADSARTMYAPPFMPVLPPSNSSEQAPAPTLYQPEGVAVSGATAQTPTAPAVDVLNQPEGVVISVATAQTPTAPAADILNQPEVVVSGATLQIPAVYVSNQPEGIVSDATAQAPASDVLNQPEGIVSGATAQTPAADVLYQPEGVVSGDAVNDLNSGNNGNGVAIISGGGEVVKRKRGRPRKYSPSEGSILPLSSPPSTEIQSGGLAVAQGSSGKRGRGRPVGSCNKHKYAATFPISPAISGSAGVGFMPHTIIVKSEEDVVGRLMSFSQVDTQTLCVLSATGTISNVRLQQASSWGAVAYEGCFEILSLSGSFLLSESGGERIRTGGLSVTLAGPDGRVFGGCVAGLLTAASAVQVIVGTFLAAGQHYNEVYTAPPKHIASVEGSPPTGATFTESSGGPGSHLNPSNGGCNNSNQQTIPM